MKKLIIVAILLLLFPLVQSACVTPVIYTTYYGNTTLCQGDYYFNDTVYGFGSGVLFWRATGNDQYFDCNGSTFYGFRQGIIGGSVDFDKGLRFYANGYYNYTVKNCNIMPDPVDTAGGYPSGYFKNAIFDNVEPLSSGAISGVWAHNMNSINGWCGGSWIGDYGFDGYSYNEPWTFTLTDSNHTCGSHDFSYVGTSFQMVNTTHAQGFGRNNWWLVNVDVHDAYGNRYIAPVNVTPWVAGGSQYCYSGDTVCCGLPVDSFYGHSGVGNATIWTNSSGRFDRDTLEVNQTIFWHAPTDYIENYVRQKDDLILQHYAGSHPTCEYIFQIDGASCYSQIHQITNNTVLDIEIDPANCPSVMRGPAFYCGEVGLCFDDVMCFFVSVPEFIMSMIQCVEPFFIIIFALGIASVLVLIFKKALR
jgi:hypothetical protein